MSRPTFRQQDHHAYLREQYRLDEWIKKPPERQQRYFEGVDRFRDDIQRTATVEPQDDDLVDSLVVAVGLDPTFGTYLRNRKGATQLGDPEHWQQVREAAAGMILLRYSEACANGLWPDGGHP